MSETLLKTQQALASNGWDSARAYPWVYASASTFTIAGVDLTAVFTKGTRLKFTQTTVKYAVVVLSAFSGGNTTVTIAVNTDYTIANAAITLNYYSYQASPQGYPTFFAFTTTWGGFSSAPANTVLRYSIIGNQCTFHLAQPTSGTSNATNLTFTVPVAVKTAQYYFGPISVHDNGANQTTPGHMEVTAASATIQCFKSYYEGAWTGSGGKYCVVPFTVYEF